MYMKTKVKRAIALVLAIASLLMLVLGILSSLAGCTLQEDNKETTAGDTTADITDAVTEPKDTRPRIPIDYEPTVDGDIVHAFGIELDKNAINSNADDYAGEKAPDWFKIFGGKDAVASILIREYTIGTAGVMKKWTGANIIEGLSLYLTDKDMKDESLVSVNPSDWNKEIDGLDEIHETDTAYWRCEDLSNSTHEESIVVYILPKENELVEAVDGGIFYHGIELVININGVNRLFINKPSLFTDETSYNTLRDALSAKWGVTIPEYASIRLPK